MRLSAVSAGAAVGRAVAKVAKIAMAEEKIVDFILISGLDCIGLFGFESWY